MKYLMKRFKFSKKKSIDTMKKAGFDTSMLEGFDLEEACQKGYMTHPTRKTKIMFGKRYRNCVKKEGVDTTMSLEQAGMIADNICVNCGDFANENLRKWFKDRWVNIGKKKKGGGHPPCGTSGKKRGYAKCVPASKAARMTKKQKASATRRKRVKRFMQLRIKLEEVENNLLDKVRNQYTFPLNQRSKMIKLKKMIVESIPKRFSGYFDCK